MKPVDFEGANLKIAEHQPEYITLPAMVTEGGEVVSCWEFSDEELAEVMKTKRVYFLQNTFGDALQPIRAAVALYDREDGIEGCWIDKAPE